MSFQQKIYHLSTKEQIELYLFKVEEGQMVDLMINEIEEKKELIMRDRIIHTALIQYRAGLPMTPDDEMMSSIKERLEGLERKEDLPLRGGMEPLVFKEKE